MTFDDSLADIRTWLADATSMSLDKKTTAKIEMDTTALETKINIALSTINKKIDDLEEKLSIEEDIRKTSKTQLKIYEENLLSVSYFLLFN
jgi:hypothetical protein